MGHSAGEPADRLQLLRVCQSAFGLRALGDLLDEQLVRAGELLGANGDTLVELVTASSELVLRTFAREEVGDDGVARLRGELRSAGPVPSDDRLDARWMRHDEAAASSPRARQSSSLATSDTPKLSSHQPEE